jgi:hypothetical protein
VCGVIAIFHGKGYGAWVSVVCPLNDNSWHGRPALPAVGLL